MREQQQSKEYRSPQFQLVRQDEQNKIFFTASGGDTKLTGTLGTATQQTVTTAWE